MIEHSLKIIKSEQRDTTSVRELISTLKKNYKKKCRRAKILHCIQEATTVTKVGL